MVKSMRLPNKKTELALNNFYSKLICLRALPEAIDYERNIIVSWYFLLRKQREGHILVCKPPKATEYKELPVIISHSYILDSFVDKLRFD